MLRQPPRAGIDGLRLDRFRVGQEYEVGNSLGALLLAEQWAEPVPLDAVARPAPFGPGDPFDSRVLYRQNPPNLQKDFDSPFWDDASAARARTNRKRRL